MLMFFKLYIRGTFKKVGRLYEFHAFQFTLIMEFATESFNTFKYTLLGMLVLLNSLRKTNLNMTYLNLFTIIYI